MNNESNNDDINIYANKEYSDDKDLIEMDDPSFDREQSKINSLRRSKSSKNFKKSFIDQLNSFDENGEHFSEDKLGDSNLSHTS